MIKSLFDKAFETWNHYKKLRFLIVGGFNTAFNYFITVLFYHLLTDFFNTAVIGAIANIASIAESFTMHKLLVFRSKGDWFKEFFKGSLVYIAVTAVYASGLWFLCDIVAISIWIAPIIMAIVCCTFSYIGLSVFTFKKN